MSEESVTIVNNETNAGARILTRLSWPALVVGLVGTIACMAMAFSPGPSGKLMMGSLLYGWGFWLSMTLGMFGLMLLHHMVRGQWTLSILRILEAGSSWKIFVGLLVLFLPFLANPATLWEWADPAHVAGDATLMRKSWFLNIPGWQSRIVIVFLVFAALAWFMRASGLRQEKSGDFKLESGRSSWGAAGIVIYMLLATLLVTDLFMSLEPHWMSTMYGPWQVVAAAGGALALGILLLCLNAKSAPYSSVVFPGLTRDLGNMMFAFTMLWGYTSVSQFLIIWNGNIPEFTAYYARRSSHMPMPQVPEGMHLNHWGALGMALIAGRFFLPFLWLLAPRTKRYPLLLAKVVGWIIVMHILDTYMLIIPAIPGRAQMGPLSTQTPFDLLALVAVGGLWLGLFALNLQESPVLAQFDNRLQESKAHAH